MTPKAVGISIQAPNPVGLRPEKRKWAWRDRVPRPIRESHPPSFPICVWWRKEETISIKETILIVVRSRWKDTMTIMPGRASIQFRENWTITSICHFLLAFPFALLLYVRSASPFFFSFSSFFAYVSGLQRPFLRPFSQDNNEGKMRKIESKGARENGRRCKTKKPKTIFLFNRNCLFI